MTDPREANLPKWAQELIEQERIKASLRWPTCEKPEADFIGGHEVPDGKWVYYVVGSDLRLSVECAFKKGHGTFYREEACNGFGQKIPHKRLFLDKSDAIISLQWQVSEHAARALYRAYGEGEK